MLLITNYWHPWNTSGSFRWLHLSQHLDFDVLTSKKPNKGFKDETMPQGRVGKLYRHGYNLPAILGGLYLSLVSVFIRADKYIYTSPPESLLLGAWINQLLGRKVYVDLRDAINRPTQKNKWLVPIYQWLYRRIKNVCVTMQYFDRSKLIIRHGYLPITKAAFSETMMSSEGRLTFEQFVGNLVIGQGMRFINGNHYSSSLIATLRKLNNPISGINMLHPELFEFEPESWETISQKMKRFLEL